MLVLSRRVSQSVVIGDGIKVMVVAIGEGKVKLGFTAPDDVPVHREEVAIEIAKELSEQETKE